MNNENELRSCVFLFDIFQSVSVVSDKDGEEKRNRLDERVQRLEREKAILKSEISQLHKHVRPSLILILSLLAFVFLLMLMPPIPCLFLCWHILCSFMCKRKKNKRPFLTNTAAARHILALCMCVCVCVSVCVCERERERESMCVLVCVCE